MHHGLARGGRAGDRVWGSQWEVEVGEAAPAAAPPEKAEWAARLELVPPKGVELYGGADIESRVDRRGVLFVAATGRTPRAFGPVLWAQERRGAAWESTLIDLGDLYPGGRGSLSVEADGNLYLTPWGENSQAYRLKVPGWAR